MVENKKITSKQYIAKYVYLKILFGEYKIGDFIPSESTMAKYFNTTNLTIRSSYNLLIANDLVKPIKGKGYQVVVDPIEHFWPFILKVQDWKTSVIKKNNYIEFTFFNHNHKTLISKWFINDDIILKGDINSIIRNIINKKINIDNFFEMTISNIFKHEKNNIIVKTIFHNKLDKNLLVVETIFNLSDIDYFLSNVKQIRII